MKFKYILITLSMVCGLISHAQQTAQNLPIRIFVFHETNQLYPGLRFFDQPLHPGLRIGTEWKLNKHSRRDVFLTANVGGFYHKLLSAGVFLDSEIGYRFHLKWQMYIQGQVGLGYLHGFYPGEVYEYDESMGRFSKANNVGYPALRPSISVAIGTSLGDKFLSPDFFLMYQYAPEIPFNYAGLHQMLGFGVTFYPFQR